MPGKWSWNGIIDASGLQGFSGLFPVILKLSTKSGILLAQLQVFFVRLSAGFLELDDNRFQHRDYRRDELSTMARWGGIKIPVSSRVEM